MKIQLLFILTVSAFLYTSCSKTPNAPGPDLAPSTQSRPLEAKPFKGEVYRAINDSEVITLISKDELEWRTKGTTFVCKYSKQDDKLRVVMQAFGSTQARYYRLTDEGLQSDDGAPLYNPVKYATTKQALIVNDCIMNLKRIDMVKESWAIQNKKKTGDTPNMSDLVPYLNNIEPRCPVNRAAYFPNPLGHNPTCPNCNPNDPHLKHHALGTSE